MGRQSLFFENTREKLFLHPNFRFKENKDNCEKRYSTIVNKHKKDWEWDFQITTFRPSNIQMLKTIVDVEKSKYQILCILQMLYGSTAA